MKKFLCYDTNDAVSGKINVDSRGMLKPNSTVPSTNGAANQQLVTDGEGRVRWEDRLAYNDSKLVVNTGDGSRLIKVTDEVPSWASIDAPIKVWLSNGMSVTTNPEDYEDLGNGSFASSEFAFFIATDNFDDEGVVFPEKGVYFMSIPDDVYTSGISSADSDMPEITWDGNIETIKTIDPKHIPADHINSLIDAKLGVIENGSY